MPIDLATEYRIHSLELVILVLLDALRDQLPIEVPESLDQASVGRIADRLLKEVRDADANQTSDTGRADGRDNAPGAGQETDSLREQEPQLAEEVSPDSQEGDSPNLRGPEAVAE